MPSPSRGYTLIELIVALAVASTLTAVCVPSFLELVHETRLAGGSNELVAHIQLARQGAVQFRTRATLCPVPLRPRDTACGSDWNMGYRVFIDRNGNARLDAPDDVLLAETVPAAQTITLWRSFRRLNYLQFEADGTTRALNGSFLLCRAGATQPERRVVLNLAGRVRVERLAQGSTNRCR